MTIFIIFAQTARVLFSKPVIFCLCAVGLFLPRWPPFGQALAAFPLHSFLVLAICGLLQLPAMLLITWHTACIRSGCRANFRDAGLQILSRTPDLLLLAVVLGVAWFLPSLLWFLTMPALSYLLQLVLVFFSIALPILLFEGQSVFPALCNSWCRLKRQPWAALGIYLVIYPLSSALFGAMFFALPAGFRSSMIEYEYSIMVFLYHFATTMQYFIWNVAITCFYLHVSPEAVNPTLDAPDSPLLAAPNQDEQLGEPAPLGDPHGVAPSE